MVISTVNVAAEDIEIENYEIKITTVDQYLSIEESITTTKTDSENIYEMIVLWMPTDAQEIKTLFNNNPTEPENSTGNEYTYNLTSLNISMNQSIQVAISYNLDKSIGDFDKTLIHNTETLSVFFDDENAIYSAENLQPSSSFALKLYKPTETPLSMFTIALVVLLIILLIVTTLHSLRKQKSQSIKNAGSESAELLSTKKMLLLSVLKDVEKQHRAKKISDDTYHKLKDQYKQEAVDSMKKLEDIESKIK